MIDGIALKRPVANLVQHPRVKCRIFVEETPNLVPSEYLKGQLAHFLRRIGIGNMMLINVASISNSRVWMAHEKN
jgi:hypothetical protein